MKSLILGFALCFAFVANGFGQGHYSFGSETNPELVLEVTHPGYQPFTTAIQNNLNEGGQSVDWEGVSDAISNVPSLEAYSNWLSANIGGHVYVHCCTLQSGQSCAVAVPMSCSACGCDAGEEELYAPW
ncbi:MAG: hypothetical protein ACFB10_26760 [Salibacteraceae bacterium]